MLKWNTLLIVRKIWNGFRLILCFWKLFEGLNQAFSHLIFDCAKFTVLKIEKKSNVGLFLALSNRTMLKHFSQPLTFLSITDQNILGHCFRFTRLYSYWVNDEEWLQLIWMTSKWWKRFQKSSKSTCSTELLDEFAKKPSELILSAFSVNLWEFIQNSNLQDLHSKWFFKLIVNFEWNLWLWC